MSSSAKPNFLFLNAYKLLIVARIEYLCSFLKNLEDNMVPKKGLGWTSSQNSSSTVKGSNTFEKSKEKASKDAGKEVIKSQEEKEVIQSLNKVGK